MRRPLKDWDDAFANMAHIPGSEALPKTWQQDAASYRASPVAVETDIPYGDHPRERFDLVRPDGPPKGLVVFVHGGYWMQLDKTSWTHFAEGARAQGWAVCLPSYPLAPESPISRMTTSIARAIETAAAMIAGPIRLSGHSAGGHLVTRMVCHDTPLSAKVQRRVQHVMSISGVHDLRPLLHTKMNDTLGLDPVAAERESPVLAVPAAGAQVTCWVGGGERPEFIRQSRLLAMIWDGLDCRAQCHIDQQHNHFSVIDGLQDRNSDIIHCLLTGQTPGG